MYHVILYFLYLLIMVLFSFEKIRADETVLLFAMWKRSGR